MTVLSTIKPDGGAIALVLNSTGRLTRANASLGLLLPAGNNFRFGFWVYLTSKAAYSAVFSVWEFTSGNQRSYVLAYDNSSDRWWWRVNTNGTAPGGNVSAYANNFGSPPLNTWTYVECGVEGGNSFIRVNRGTPNTTAFAVPVFSGTAPFNVGGENNSNQATMRIDEGYFWIDNGANDLPTSDECDAVYNSGAGLSWGELLDLEITMPYAAWSFEETSGTRYDRVGDKHLSSSGTLSTTAGHIVTADYTLLQTWGADLAATYDGSEAWIAECYAGGDLLGNANYTLGNVQGSGVEPITIRAAEDDFHGGDPTAGAYTEFDLTIFNCDDIYVDGLRFEGSDLSFDGGGSNRDWRATRNLIHGGLLQAYLAAVDLVGLLIENNLCLNNPAFGILVILDATTSNANLSEAYIRHNTVIGVDDGDYGIEVIGAESSGEATATVDLLNNCVIGAAFSVFADNITNLTLDQRGNATSDELGEITGLAAADVFADSGSGNYQTKAGGPTYRSGVTTPTEFDLLLRPRSGSTPDIGAFEIPLVIAGAAGVQSLRYRPRFSTMGRKDP